MFTYTSWFGRGAARGTCSSLEPPHPFALHKLAHLTFIHCNVCKLLPCRCTFKTIVGIAVQKSIGMRIGQAGNYCFFWCRHAFITNCPSHYITSLSFSHYEFYKPTFSKLRGLKLNVFSTIPLTRTKHCY